MARIFKQTYTKPVPPDAEVINRKGQRLARFKDSRGKSVSIPLTEDGNRIIRQTAKWYIEYNDADGIIRKVPGFKDKQATEQRAQELEKTAEHIRSGYKPKEHEQLNRLLSEHIEDFRESLKSKGNGKSHVDQTVKRIKCVFEKCEFLFWKDISASKVMNCIAGLEHRKQKISTQTFNYYLQSTKQFCKWMVEDGRVDVSPVKHLNNVTVIPTFERRAGTVNELIKLLEVAKAGPVRFGLIGHERFILYRFAAETGLRAKEILSLTVSSFNFDDCTVLAKVGYTKNKEKGIIPLKKNTVVLLKDFMKGKLPTAQAFKMPSKFNMAKMLRKDLACAHKKWLNEAEANSKEYQRREKSDFLSDEGFDFNALRHTFITSLRTVPSRIAQSLARHKSSKMTDRYTHIGLLDERKAIEDAIPDYSLSNNRNKNVATGTDAFVLDFDGHNGLFSHRSSLRFDATGRF